MSKPSPTVIDPNPTRTLAELEQAVLAGEHVTPEEFAHAKAAAELANLHARADELTAERAAAERLEQDRAEFRVSFAAEHAEALAAGRAAYTAFVSAAPKLLASIEVLNRTIRNGQARARQLGISDEIDAQPVRADEMLARALDEAAGRPKLSGAFVMRNPSEPTCTAPHLMRHVLHDPKLADARDAELRAEANARAAAARAEVARRRAAATPEGVT